MQDHIKCEFVYIKLSSGGEVQDNIKCELVYIIVEQWRRSAGPHQV